MEQDDDESAFDLLSQDQELATDVNDDIPVNVVLGNQRVNSGGITTRKPYGFTQSCK